MVSAVQRRGETGGDDSSPRRSPVKPKKKSTARKSTGGIAPPGLAMKAAHPSGMCETRSARLIFPLLELAYSSIRSPEPYPKTESSVKATAETKSAGTRFR